MTEFDSICLELKGKESLELLGNLLKLKKEMLITTLLTQTDKDKAWDIKTQITFIDAFSREIASKANRDE